jgi:hypothetical protein
MKGESGMTLPNVGIFINPAQTKNKDLLRHEFGHILQHRKWGNEYYSDVIIPTSVNSTLDKYDHMSTWTEWSANYLSYMWFNQPKDWNFTDYPIAPTNPSNPRSSFPR